MKGEVEGWIKMLSKRRRKIVKGKDLPNMEKNLINMIML